MALRSRFIQTMVSFSIQSLPPINVPLGKLHLWKLSLGRIHRGLSRCTGGLLAFLLLSTTVLLTGCQQPLRPQDALVTATVQQVISGNTLEVIVPSLANNQIQRLRLIGFDAPAPGQRPWGKEAMDFLRQVDKETIQLEFDQERQDSYDRLLAYVWHNGELLNLAMVAEGHALMDSRLPNIRYEDQLRRGQEAARLQGLGIWDPANPMRQTPDEFQEQRPQ